MKLSIHADIDLESGDGTSSYVTWFDVSVSDARGATHGRARVAVVHVGEIADALGELGPALHGTPLEPLATAYFAQGWYKDDFADGAGIDLLFVESVEFDDTQRAKNLDLAMVRRLCDTVGSGCQLAVVSYRDAHAAAHWRRLGFSQTTPGRSSGLMHMKLGYHHARVVDTTGRGDYEVLPTGLYRARCTAN